MIAIERIEAGMTGLEAHEIAASVITEMGYGDYFGHGLGHGVGIDVHENPRLSPASDTILENGHVFTIEPGVYLPNWGGVRIEDQCLMESGKVRSLTKSPKLDLEIAFKILRSSTRGQQRPKTILRKTEQINQI